MAKGEALFVRIAAQVTDVNERLQILQTIHHEATLTNLAPELVPEALQTKWFRAQASNNPEIVVNYLICFTHGHPGNTGTGRPFPEPLTQHR